MTRSRKSCWYLRESIETLLFVDLLSSHGLVASLVNLRILLIMSRLQFELNFFTMLEQRENELRSQLLKQLCHERSSHSRQLPACQLSFELPQLLPFRNRRPLLHARIQYGSPTLLDITDTFEKSSSSAFAAESERRS